MSIETYIAKQRLRGISEANLKATEAHLKRMTAMSDEELEAYWNTLHVNTRYKRMWLIKKYYAFIGEDRFSNLELPITKQGERVPKTLTDKEVQELVRYASSMKKNFTEGWEFRMFLHLGLFMGLRLSEILQVSKNSVSGNYIKILRKGGREQMLPVPRRLLLYIQKFDGFTQSPRKLSEDLAEAGFKMNFGRRIHPHMLRHTFASRAMSEDGRNVFALQEFLGHRSLSSTSVYVHINPAHLSRLVDEKE